ncbi:MAG: hypothetical protein ACI8O8_003089, partial [Oleiphilaceae bacterium]
RWWRHARHGRHGRRWYGWHGRHDVNLPPKLTMLAKKPALVAGFLLSGKPGNLNGLKDGCVTPNEGKKIWMARVSQVSR